MKEFNALLKYRSQYIYSLRHEFLRIGFGEDREDAVKVYSSLIKNLYLQGEERWALDIALDCVRRFTEEEIDIIKRNKEIENYHFGYGLYVRNRYVHSSLFHAYLMPDHISSLVYKFIVAIICEDVNPFKENT